MNQVVVETLLLMVLRQLSQLLDDSLRLVSVAPRLLVLNELNHGVFIIGEQLFDVALQVGVEQVAFVRQLWLLFSFLINNALGSVQYLFYTFIVVIIWQILAVLSTFTDID